MKRTAKRPKYITDLINRANKTFRAMNVKNPYESDLFMMLDDLLLEKNMYEGFNYFVEKTNENGEKYLTHAGTSDPTKFDCIQIY